MRKESYPTHRRRDGKESVLGYRCKWARAITDWHFIPLYGILRWSDSVKDDRRKGSHMHTQCFVPSHCHQGNLLSSTPAFLYFISFLYHQELLSVCPTIERTREGWRAYLYLISSEPCLHQSKSWTCSRGESGRKSLLPSSELDKGEKARQTS